MFESFDVDFMFTSFRKQLPVPDGAWVLAKYDGLVQCKEENHFAQYKLAGGILKTYRRLNFFSDKMYLELFEKGEELIKENLNAKISDVTIQLLNKINFELVRKKRVENANLVIDGIKKFGVSSLIKFEKGQTPLFVPVSLQNRDHVRKELQNNNIFCPVHWPRCKETHSLNQKLYDTELSLLIDQRYNTEDINKMLVVIEKCMKDGKQTD